MIKGLYNMRRKVIQIADSTQLVSLPRKWALKQNLKKGDELSIDEKGSQLVISADTGPSVEKTSLKIDDLEPMTLRYIVALYKKGIDLIDVSFDNPEKIRVVQQSIGKEAVGFEITDQTINSCVIKHVSGELEDFDPIMRRTFLLLNSMAKQTYEALEKGRLENLKNAAYLEEANNRFTTTCRRLLNKKGYKGKEIGPLYYIIEELENIADQYKYLCNYFYSKKNKSIKISKNVMSLLKDSNEVLDKFYNIFYDYKVDKIVSMGKLRKQVVDRSFHVLEKSNNSDEVILAHYCLTIVQKVFCLIGPYLVIAL